MLPMSALLIGLIWTIAIMSLFGRPITLATLSLPTTMMAVGSSYIFHVLNQYRISMQHLNAGGRRRSKRGAWIDGLAFIGPAVIVSGTSTAAGFGALASSTVPTARDMGIFEALGVLALLLLTVAFIPAALALLPRNALGRASSTQTDYVRWLNRTLSNITALVLFRRRGVLLATFAATMLVGVGAVWLQVNTDYLRIFPSGSETVRDAGKMHERLAGAATVQLVVSGAAGSVTNPKFITATQEPRAVRAYAGRRGRGRFRRRHHRENQCGADGFAGSSRFDDPGRPFEARVNRPRLSLRRRVGFAARQS